MSKKNQQRQVPQKYQNAPQFTNSKKQGKGGSSLDVLEANDADQMEYLSLLPDDYPFGNPDTQNNSMLFLIAQKILGDFKHLLQIPFKNFWATLKYNLFLQDSLDLFLRYSPREHLFTGTKPKGLSNEYWSIIQEIYRCILSVYTRMVSYEEEDQVGHLVQAWGCTKILYDNWLIDIMKMTDIAEIYGPTNPSIDVIYQLIEIVRKIITSVFNCNKEYYSDFKGSFKAFLDKILSGIYQTLSGYSNQSSMEAEVFTEDIKQRMQTLVLTLDSIQSMLVWVDYFPPECVRIVLNNTQAVAAVEQIFYEILFARGTNFSEALGFVRGEERVHSYWKIEKMGKQIQPVLEVILEKILILFRAYFEHVVQIIMVVQDKNDRQSISLLNEHIQYILNNLGLVRRKGTIQKKNQSKNDIKAWYLVEGLADRGFSLAELLQNLVPWEALNQVDKGEKDEFVDLIAQVLEQRIILKSIMEGNPKVEEEEPLLLDEIEAYDPEQSALEELQRQFELEEQAKEKQQSEDQQFVQKAEEKLTQVVSKRQQKVTLELPPEKRQEIAKMMANIYDDEPDDTYEHDIVRKVEPQSDSDDDGYFKHKKVIQRKAPQNNNERDFNQSYEQVPEQRRTEFSRGGGKQDTRNQGKHQSESFRSQKPVYQEKSALSESLQPKTEQSRNDDTFDDRKKDDQKNESKNDGRKNDDVRRNEAPRVNEAPSRGQGDRNYDDRGNNDRRNDNRRNDEYRNDDRRNDDYHNDNRSQGDRGGHGQRDHKKKGRNNRKNGNRQFDDNRPNDNRPNDNRPNDNRNSDQRNDNWSEKRGSRNDQDQSRGSQNRGGYIDSRGGYDDSRQGLAGQDYSTQGNNRGGGKYNPNKYNHANTHDSDEDYQRGKNPQTKPVLQRDNTQGPRDKDGAYVENVYQLKDQKRGQR